MAKGKADTLEGVADADKMNLDRDSRDCVFGWEPVLEYGRTVMEWFSKKT